MSLFLIGAGFIHLLAPVAMPMQVNFGFARPPSSVFRLPSSVVRLLSSFLIPDTLLS